MSAHEPQGLIGAIEVAAATGKMVEGSASMAVATVSSPFITTPTERDLA